MICGRILRYEHRVPPAAFCEGICYWGGGTEEELQASAHSASSGRVFASYLYLADIQTAYPSFVTVCVTDGCHLPPLVNLQPPVTLGLVQKRQISDRVTPTERTALRYHAGRGHLRHAWPVRFRSRGLRPGQWFDAPPNTLSRKVLSPCNRGCARLRPISL